MNSYAMNFGSVYMIASWILVAFSTYALIVFLFGRKKGAKHHDSDLEILNKRYAKGEIDSEAYQKIKKELREG